MLLIIKPNEAESDRRVYKIMELSARKIQVQRGPTGNRGGSAQRGKSNDLAEVVSVKPRVDTGSSGGARAVPPVVPQALSRHEALADIYESIAELKHYRTHWLGL
jgi:hypothetical protein